MPPVQQADRSRALARSASVGSTVPVGGKRQRFVPGIGRAGLVERLGRLAGAARAGCRSAEMAVNRPSCHLQSGGLFSQDGVD